MSSFSLVEVEPGIRELDLSVGNHLGETVKDLVITTTTEHENDTMELSTSKDPFEPQQTLTFEDRYSQINWSHFMPESMPLKDKFTNVSVH